MYTSFSWIVHSRRRGGWIVHSRVHGGDGCARIHAPHPSTHARINDGVRAWMDAARGGVRASTAARVHGGIRISDPVYGRFSRTLVL